LIKELICMKQNNIRNWTDDFKFEDGMYTNTCRDCKCEFLGFKIRRICKKCADLNNARPTFSWFYKTSYSYIEPKGCIGHIKFYLQFPKAYYKFLKHTHL